MTYSNYGFDGYIELEDQEMSRLKGGDKFLTVVRPATQNSSVKYGSPGDTLGAREAESMRPQFNLRMVSNFFTNGKWIMVFSRLNTA